MIVTGLTLQQIRDVVARVSHESYADNLIVRTGANLSRTRARFTLGTLSGKEGAPGARGSASVYSHGSGPYGTRATRSACWHAHYAVIAALFTAGAKRIRSHVGRMSVSYTPDTFVGKAEMTRYANVGSLMCPTSPTDLCSC